MNGTVDGKIRYALVGCGSIADKHIAAIGRLDNSEVVGACDINPKTAVEFERKHSIPSFTDGEEMIERTNPDVLNILTPSGLHGEHILRLISFNKHFVVEKPFCLSLRHIDEILAECDRRDLRIFVVQQNRFNPPIQKLKQAIQKGRFGKLVMGTVRVRWSRDQAYYDQRQWRGTWALDGGVLTNQASHHIDMLIWMMGEVESVMAKTATRLANIEAEDTGVAVLRFRNGALGIVEATTATRPKDLEGSISILGERGTVEIGGFFMNELKTWSFSQPEPGDSEIFEKFGLVPDQFAWSHTEFFKDVADSLLHNTKGLIDGLEGRKSVELINAIYESAETGNEVFLRFTPQRCRLGVANGKQDRNNLP